MENTTESLMKRQRIMIVIIGILAFVTLTSFVYAFVQQGIANEMSQLAEKNAKQLNMCVEEARKLQKIAESNAIETNLQHQRAEEALRKMPKK